MLKVEKQIKYLMNHYKVPHESNKVPHESNKVPHKVPHECYDDSLPTKIA